MPTIADLGISRLTEFENKGGSLALFNSYSRVYEERYSELGDFTPLPIRTPFIYKGQSLPTAPESNFMKSSFVFGLIDTFRKTTSLGNTE